MMKQSESGSEELIEIKRIPPTEIGFSSYRSGNFERYLSIDGRRRRYLIHVPQMYDHGMPTPVILVFHGGGGDAENIRWSSKMDEKSDTAGFIVVYPDGTGPFEKKLHTFHVGPGYGYAWENKIDDVKFVEYLLNDVEKLFNIDSKRIYATGLSNGAMMSYRVLSDLSEKIAAIAPIGGSLPIDYLSFDKVVNIIHFHGMKDKYFPFEGGFGKSLNSKEKQIREERAFEPVLKTIYKYIKLNQASKRPSQTEKIGKATKQVFGPGDGGSEIILWTIEDGGHTWPSGRHLLKRFGKISSDISANDLMWEFFQKHPLQTE